MDIQQLMDALNQQRQQMVGSQINLETMYPEWERANTRSRQGLISGLIESAWDSRKRKQLEPEYRGALSAAMDAEAGYNDLAAQLEALQAEQQAAKQRAAELETYEGKKQIDQRYPGQQKQSERVRNWEFAQSLPPEQRDQFLKMSGGGVNIHTGDSSKVYSEFQKAAPAELKTWQDDAATAQGFLNVASDMERILQDYSGGKVQSALAALGQYLPEGTNLNELASNQQMFDAAANQGLKQALQKMRGLGQMTEVEFKEATKELSKFSNTREANEYLIRIMKDKAQRSVDTYNSALNYMGNPEFEQWGFAKFRPDYTKPPAGGGKMTVGGYTIEEVQ